MDADARTTPAEISQHSPRELKIVWGDGQVCIYDVAYLRRNCRCALCVDEWSGRRILREDQVSDDVRPRVIKPVGNYAIHVEWSDGHTSGIYAFELLRELCPGSGPET